MTPATIFTNHLLVSYQYLLSAGDFLRSISAVRGPGSETKIRWCCNSVRSAEYHVSRAVKGIADSVDLVALEDV